jgi:hypothetical protein
VLSYSLQRLFYNMYSTGLILVLLFLSYTLIPSAISATICTGLILVLLFLSYIRMPSAVSTRTCTGLILVLLFLSYILIPSTISTATCKRLILVVLFLACSLKLHQRLFKVLFMRKGITERPTAYNNYSGWPVWVTSLSLVVGQPTPGTGFWAALYEDDILSFSLSFFLVFGLKVGKKSSFPW